MKDAILSRNPAALAALSRPARRVRQVVTIVLVACTLGTLIGCGQKGPLTPPTPELQTPPTS